MNSKLTLRKRVALELFRTYRNNTKKLHPLNYIFWECTLRCNLNCLHCGSDCKKDTSVKDMPIADFIQAIDDITPSVQPNQTTIVFTGGEPLMRKDLELCGKQLYQRGFPWGMVTNGFLMNEKRLNSLLEAGLHAISVSLDGFETAHNWLRGQTNSYNKALSAIQMLAQIPELEFDVVTCVNQRNFHDLKAFEELLLSKGVRQWRLFTIVPLGRAKEHPDLQLNTLQFKQLFDFIAEERKLGQMRINYGCEGYLGNYEGEVRDNLFFCRAGVTIASVLADGSLAACPNLRDNFIQGNIYKDSFRDVWETKYQIFRNRDWMKTGKCATCKAFKYCDGSGMHLRDEENGELIFCHLNRIQEGEKGSMPTQSP